MKWLPLLWAALRRKPGRSIFTLLSIMIAFVLVGSMTGLNATFDQFLEDARADRIIVNARFGVWYPRSHLDQIKQIETVTDTSFNARLEAHYQMPENFLLVFMTTPDAAAVQPEWGITAEDFAKLTPVRDGFLATDVAAEKYGWKVGDLIPFDTDRAYQDGTRTWTLRLVGTVPASERFPETSAIGNYVFFDEARADGRRDDIHQIYVVVDDPDHAVETANRIEALFANSVNPVFAQPERTLIENNIQGTVDVRFFTFAVSTAALFMLLFLTGNVMAQSVRERVPEFAVMKTIGFTDTGVFTLVIVESAFLCLLGAALGLVVAYFIPGAVDLVLPNVPTPIITAGVISISFISAIIVAAISGLPAAWRVKQLSIAEALGGR